MDSVEKLKENEDKYAYLFEYAPISIWEEDFSEVKKHIEKLKKKGVSDFRSYFNDHPSEILHISGLIKVININQETLKMFGVKTKAEIPLNLPKYFTEKSLPIFTEEILSFINGENTFESAIPIVSLEGDPIILDIKASILTGYEHTWEKVLVSFINVTDQKKAEAALKERETQLRQSNITKDKFFSIIAHDLKGPFSSILGFSKLLKDDFEEFEVSKQKEILDYIYESAINTYDLLENLLTWSRSQNGTIEFNPENVNVFLLCKRIVELMEQQALDKEIIIENKVVVNLMARADINMLSLILRNLISNALKFTPRGGLVTISANQLENKSHSNLVEISVEDNGLGISKTKQDMLFSISENVSSHGTEREQGTGLGLVLCKEFIEKHQGRIFVESKEKLGSKFTFTIPSR